MKTVWIALLCGLTCGCAMPSRPSRVEYNSTNDLSTVGDSSQAKEPQPEPAVEVLGGLKMDQALEIAERSRPELASVRAQVEAAAGRAHQAGLLPNPTAIAVMESAPIDGRTTAEAEYIAGFSQPVVIGGRLSAASRVENAERERLLKEFEARRLEVRREVQGAFATVLYLQEVMAAQRDALQVAENGVEAARARLEAGDAVPEEVARAELERLRTRLELERAQSLSKQAVTGLVAELGNTNLQVESVEGVLDSALEIPTLETLSTRLSESPFLTSAEAAIEVDRARLRLAESQRIPDVNLLLFYRRLEHSDTNAFDVGVSLPIPIFDRNQGRLREMQARIVASEAEARLTRNELERNLRQAHERLRYALSASRVLRSEVLPRAEEVLGAAEVRYAGGDSSLTDVLAVRRDYIGVRLSYLESLREVMQAWANLSPYLKDGGSPQT